MTDTGTQQDLPAPACEFTREVRFAVVMYGGVSLAIYINGVAQELFHLVRATAVDPAHPGQPLHKQLTGTEKVYRRLGQMLGADRAGKGEMPAETAAVRTKFVVDILSGTSAGGINAIYLAKALANDQDFGSLQQLWYDEGDIGRLINDAESFDGVPKIKLEPPKSLLNSKRMYYKLLQAFEGMDGPRPSTTATQSPYVDQVDLFVTATDLRGLALSLRLADGVVAESRHRKVFHLRYDKSAQCNDFVRVNNPFLAYAARCTSSFPFAFEPMQLKDIAPFGEPRCPEWAKFFPEDPQHYVERPFADGGYLDNKPFSYAIDMLGAHHAVMPVDRKLIYVEPSPEHPEDVAQDFTPPNAIENVLAFDTLAHDETIREDLQRVLARNQLLERVERFLSGMEEDLALRPPARHEEGERFAQTDLRDKIGEEGIAYGGYHRLKVSSLTEWLAELVARAANLDLESDDFTAVRYLMRAWRDDHYAPFASAKATENRFLMDYDLPYRIRRLEFVLQRMDSVAVLDGVAMNRLRKIDQINQQQEQREQARTTEPGAPPPRHPAPSLRRFLQQPDPKSFRKETFDLRGKLTQFLDSLRRAEENLKCARALAAAATGVTTAAGHVSLPGRTQKEQEAIVAFAKAVASLGLTIGDLHDILNAPTDVARVAKARDLAATHAPAVAAVAQVLAQAISDTTKVTGKGCEDLLDGAGGAAHEVARHYYFNYERYDLISFPVLYATDVGDERAAIEVIRISPEDAKSLVDERRQNRHKLAGIALLHFGAFLERSWRKNDLLWGRLDGAERLIATLLVGTPYADCREDLIRDAQVAILEEHFGAADRDEFSRVYTDAVTQAKTADENTKVLCDYAAEQLSTHLKDTLQTTMRAALTGTQIRDFLKRAPDTVDRKPNPEASVRELARSTQVIGKMLQGIAEDKHLPTGPATWVARLGRVLWGLVEVSVPRSVPTLLFRYALQLVYLFEALLVAAGIVFAPGGVLRFGLGALAVTLAVHLSTFLLADILQGRQRHRLRLQWLGAAAAALLVGAAGYIVVSKISGFPASVLSKPIQLDARLIACLAGAIATVMTIAGAVLSTANAFLGPKHRPNLPPGIRLPGLALELAHESAEVATIVGPIDGQIRDILRAQNDFDFVVIAAYWTLLLTLSGFCIGLRNAGVWLGAVAAISATTAALFDVVENFRLYALLDAHVDVGAHLTAFRQASRCKWGALFSTMAPLGASLLWHSAGPLRLLGGWFALTAAVGGTGVVRHTRAIQTGFFMLLAAFVAVAAAFAMWPQRFLAGI